MLPLSNTTSVITARLLGFVAYRYTWLGSQLVPGSG